MVVDPVCKLIDDIYRNASTVCSMYGFKVFTEFDDYCGKISAFYVPTFDLSKGADRVSLIEVVFLAVVCHKTSVEFVLEGKGLSGYVPFLFKVGNDRRFSIAIRIGLVSLTFFSSLTWHRIYCISYD